MLQILTHILYKNKVYTDERRLFAKTYKWPAGLIFLIALRYIISGILFLIIGLCFLFAFTSKYIGCIFIIAGLNLIRLHLKEERKAIVAHMYSARTPMEMRTIDIESFIRKIITLHSKAIGKKEWKKIKKHNSFLYDLLLSDEVFGRCYSSTLEIACIIKDSIVIWGGIKDLTEENESYNAHAILLRNGYIYDPNLRISIKYKDYLKLYKFKTFKEWKYDEYSAKDFRSSERAEFRKWCVENNVLEYEKF